MGIGAEIVRDLKEIATLAAKRLPELVRAADLTLAEADRDMYRMAIFAAVLEDKPSLEAILTEIERMAREIQ